MCHDYSPGYKLKQGRVLDALLEALLARLNKRPEWWLTWRCAGSILNLLIFRS